MNNIMMNSYFGLMNSAAAAAAFAQPTTLPQQQQQQQQQPQPQSHQQEAHNSQYGHHNGWSTGSNRMGLIATQHHNIGLSDAYDDANAYLKEPSLSSLSSSSSSFTSLSPNEIESQHQQHHHNHRNYQYSHDPYYGFAPVTPNTQYLLDPNLKYINTSSPFTVPTPTATTTPSSSSFLSTQSPKSPPNTKTSKQQQQQQHQQQQQYDFMQMAAVAAAAAGHHNPYQTYFNAHPHIDVSAAVAANEFYSAYLSTAANQQQHTSNPISSLNANNATVASRLLTPALNQSLKAESIDLLNHHHQSSFEIVQNPHAVTTNGATQNAKNSLATTTSSTSSNSNPSPTQGTSQIYPWMKRLHNSNEPGE
jgi:hypothetical protein